MRFLIAQFSHETNTFSPVPTPIARFCREGDTPLSGEAAIAHYRGTGTCMGGFLDIAASVGAEIVVPIAASAPPSGPVERSTYEACAKAITEAVAKGGFDGLMLDLHGAMVAEHVEDGEGELLRRIRAIDAKVADRRRARHARQYLRGHRQALDGHRRLSPLPAHRHGRDGASRRRASRQGDPRRGAPGDGLGQCADASACHGARHASGAEQDLAGEGRALGEGGHGAFGRALRRLLARRYSRGGLERRRHHGWRCASRRNASSTSFCTRPGRRGTTLSSRSSPWRNRSRAPRRCRPRRRRSCSSTITTIAPRAARWTRPPCSPRSCARGSTMSPSSASMIRRRLNKRSRPASARG